MTTVSNPHPFDKLVASTRNLHARFGTAQTVKAAIRIAEEEWQETVTEAQLMNADKLAHETADLFVTLIGLCDLCGVTDRDLQSAMIEVAAKNDAKIPGITHEINPISRKIQRIHRSQS